MEKNTKVRPNQFNNNQLTVFEKETRVSELEDLAIKDASLDKYCEA
jgi:hypothetical protein